MLSFWNWIGISSVKNFSGSTIFVFYSPKLNLIKILWRFIKYEWIDIDAYSSWETFIASIEKFLRKFEKNSVVNFV